MSSRVHVPNDLVTGEAMIAWRIGIVALAFVAVGCAGEPRIGDQVTAQPAGDGGTDEQAVEPAGPMAIEEFERRWTALLRGRVDAREGLVDYAAMREQAQELRTLTEAVGVKRDIADARQRLTLLVNAYNLLVVNAIVEHRPAGTVRSVVGFFDKKKHRVLGESVTLDELRDRMIRPLGDPRIHAALCNGAAGSGVLGYEAYTAAKLDDQLTGRSIRFVNSRSRNAAVDGVLMLSPIFRWFADDFATDAIGGPVGFCKLYAEPDSPIDQVLRLTNPGDEPPVEYLDFNWALNAKR